MALNVGPRNTNNLMFLSLAASCLFVLLKLQEPEWTRQGYAVMDETPIHIWTTDFHIATIEDAKDLLRPYGVQFYDQSLTPRCSMFNSCAHNLTILNFENGINLNHSLIPMFYEAYKDNWQMQHVDAFLCYHPTALCELYIPFNRSIITVASTRYEHGRGDKESWLKWNNNLRQLSQDPKHIIAANNRYDARYIEYFTGIKPKIISSYCGYTNATYTPIKEEFLLFSGRGVHEERFYFFNEEFRLKCKEMNCSVDLVHYRKISHFYTYEQISNYKGFVYVPYQVSTMSIFEHFRMNVPMFFPSVKLLIDWHKTHNILHEKSWYGVRHPDNFSSGSAIPPHESQQFVPDPNNDTDPRSLEYWIPLADYYHWPETIIYNSIEDLINKMTSTNLMEVSRTMKERNRQEKENILQSWQYVIDTVAKHRQHRVAKTNR